MRLRPMRLGERLYFGIVPIVLVPAGAFFALMSGLALSSAYGASWILKLYFLSIFDVGGADPVEYWMMLLAWIGSWALIFAASAIALWVVLPNSKSW